MVRYTADLRDHEKKLHLNLILQSNFRNFAEFIEKNFLIKQTDPSFTSVKDILLTDKKSNAEITLNSELVLKYIQGEFPF